MKWVYSKKWITSEVDIDKQKYDGMYDKMSSVMPIGKTLDKRIFDDCFGKNENNLEGLKKCRALKMGLGGTSTFEQIDNDLKRMFSELTQDLTSDMPVHIR